MKFIKKALKNGLRVVLVPMKDNPTITTLFLVGTGSKYENKENNGISHFLEHMCFKGTIKRPKAIDISRELDAIGSQYNAFTSQEYTGYYVKSDKKHFKKTFEILSDIYLNSSFPEVEIEKEKGVIVEEINMYEDMPHRHVQDLIMEILYKDQPAGFNVAGTKENVLKMEREDFVNYHKAHYVPNATTVVVAGNFQRDSVLKEINRFFAKIPKNKKDTKLKTIEKQIKPEILVKYKKTDQSHLVLAFRTFDLFSKKNTIISVLSGVLSSGMSSRLFQKLREEMGVCYYVRAYNDAYTDHGFFQVSVGADNKRVKEVIGVILEELNKLKTELVMNEELERTKECLIGNFKLSLELSDDIATFVGQQELLKKEIKNIEQKSAEIRKVKAEDIKKVANEIFKNEKMNLAIIGPFEEKKFFEDIFKIS